ncbi:MAG TPA: YdjY domain-containing protein [Tepidisphaeraceae bacterium]|jgi:hypothetical protein|nr:YdjY domain-containing protein [Tepidisphaeraceae bacterium]
MILRYLLMVSMSLAALAEARADDAAAPPATQPAASVAPEDGGPLRHVQIDLKNKRIRVDCEALNAHNPLEFFCVVRGAQEYESVLRTDARPSIIHFGLLAMGLKPGEPAHLDEATHIWYPPTGPTLKITCEYSLNGKTVVVPANRMMRSVKTTQEMPPMSWVFDGSRILPDGRYAADLTGYVVSIVNFDLTMIDVPELASNANETLEWEYNPALVPPLGTPVTMIIEPAGPEAATRPAQGKPADQYNPGPGLNGGG